MRFDFSGCRYGKYLGLIIQAEREPVTIEFCLEISSSSH